jgi:dTMP kinase
MSRGLFISLDGLDGCGKSTQCRLLAEHLCAKALRVTTCVDPGGTVLGDQLRAILLHHRHEISPACEALLFMASRAQLVHEVIRPALEDQQIVVADRYLLANVVYQGYGGGLDPDELWQVGRLSTGGIEPALTLVLDLPVETAAARRTGSADRFESRGPDYYARVRSGFLREAMRHPDRVSVIDADQPADAVFQAVCRQVEKFDLSVAKGA